MSIDTTEQYKSDKYQRTVELERIVNLGMESEEAYQREAAFALKAADIKFKEGDKILDLAVGQGRHANVMRNITGIDIDAYDTAEKAIEIARSLENEREIENIKNGIRGKIRFAIGDYGNIIQFIPENSHYPLITIFGGSFGYLKTREAHEKALKDFYSILEDGGKLVIQFRNRDGRKPDRKAQKEWCSKFNIETGIKTADGPSGTFGKFAKKDEEVSYIKDISQGDSFYYYRIKPHSTVDLKPKTDNDPGYEMFSNYQDKDGVSYIAFGKAYVHPNGSEENLGRAELLDYISRKNFPVIEEMLKKAGFKNVAIHEEPLSRDGSMHIYVIVAEK